MLSALSTDALSWRSNHDSSYYNSPSLLVPWAKHTPQDLVDFLIDCVALWSTWLTLSCFIQLRWRRKLPLTTLMLSFQVVLQNPCLITSDYSTKQVWFRRLMTSWHLHATLLLIIIQQSWHQFWADILHAQIFDDNILNNVPFLCPADLWSLEVSISDRHILIASPNWCWPSVLLLESLLFPGIIFHLLAPFFEPLV